MRAGDKGVNLGPNRLGRRGSVKLAKINVLNQQIDVEANSTAPRQT